MWSVNSQSPISHINLFWNRQKGEHRHRELMSTPENRKKSVVNISTTHELEEQLLLDTGEEWKLQVFDQLTTFKPSVRRECDRLAVLKSYGILDTEAEVSFDELTRAAKEMFNVPIAVISLVDLRRQWFKSIHGLEATETPRCVSFCTHVASARRHDQCLVIRDASKDFRFKDNPLVTGEPNIRFYAGAPLYSPERQILGSFCIIDFIPREFTDREEEQLLQLASEAVFNMITR